MRLWVPMRVESPRGRWAVGGWGESVGKACLAEQLRLSGVDMVSRPALLLGSQGQNLELGRHTALSNPTPLATA